MPGTENLSMLKQGEKAVITDICLSGDMGRRLKDIGFTKGTCVMCVQKSPLGDPTAYLIRGAVIALRQEDSSCIRVM